MEGNTLMDKAKKHFALIYIENNRLFFYSQASPSLFQLDFPKDVVSDLEIIQKDKFSLLIKLFLEKNKLPPAFLTVIFAPTLTFEKKFTQTPSPEQIQEFLELVPFEETISRTYSIDKQIEVVATNKEFCDSLLLTLKNQGSPISAIIPFSILQQLMPELKSKVDIAFLFSRRESLKEYNLLPLEERTEGVTTNTTQNKSKAIYFLLGIFGILIMIFIILLIINFSPHK